MKEVQPRSPSKKNFRLALSALAILGTISSASCLSPNPSRDRVVEQQTQFFQEEGLFEKQHPVVSLNEVPGFSVRGEVGGSFLSITGEFEGKTTTMLLFAWQAREGDEEIQISEIPYSRIKFNILKDQGIKPTVSFKGINPKSFVRFNGDIGWNGGYEATAMDGNLSRIVSNLDLVTISLSQEDFDSFMKTQGK